MHRVLALLTVVTLSLSTAALAEDRKDYLAALLAEAREAGGATALVLLIDDPAQGQIIVTEGSAGPDTRFYLASVGKTLVAAAALHAVDAGLLDLDAPLGDRVAGLPLADLAASRSLRDLLAHTSGLPDYLDDAFVELAFTRPGHRFTAAEALAYAEPDDVQPRGRQFDYSNTNYVLLGAILDDLDGSLEAAMARRVFGPAGMRNSSVGSNGEGDLARGYDLDGSDISAVLWNSTLGDGPVVASAPDVARFVRALFDGRTLIGPSLRSEMLREGLAGSGYGLGIGVESDDWGRWYGHSGGFEGAATDFRHYSETGTTLVLLVNADTDIEWVMDEAAAIWFR